MDLYGFIKVAAGVPVVHVADPAQNVQEMEHLLKKAFQEKVHVLVFPELSVTGSTCADLFFQPSLWQASEKALKNLLQRTRKLPVLFVVGMPVSLGGSLLNAAVVCCQGNILGVVPKTYLHRSGGLDQHRWFSSLAEGCGTEIHLCGQQVPVGSDLLFNAGGALLAVELGADAWSCKPLLHRVSQDGADVVCHLAAQPVLVGSEQALHAGLAQRSAQVVCGYVHANSGYAESSTDFVFDGNACIYENGKLLNQAKRFSLQAQLVVTEVDVERLRFLRRQKAETGALLSPSVVIESGLEAPGQAVKLTRRFEVLPFVAEGAKGVARCQEIMHMQATALTTRLLAARAQTAVLGISGGLDSTWALLVCVEAFDRLGWPRKKIIGVTMPGFGTTAQTLQNARQLMKHLKITHREIDITAACLQHFKDIGHDKNTHDVTYENTQARERTQVLMDISNQTQGLVIGTGDLSELALGWATYNGDHMSMYGVNGGVPKTLVRALVAWASSQPVFASVRSVLTAVLDTPVSPELLPKGRGGKMTQKTEEVVGPYELHDFFLYHFMRGGCSPAKLYHLACYSFKNQFTAAVIKKWLTVFFRRFFTQQFKRSCLPDGPTIGTVGLSPRGGWQMPSDACVRAWLEQVEQL